MLINCLTWLRIIPLSLFPLQCPVLSTQLKRCWLVHLRPRPHSSTIDCNLVWRRHLCAQIVAIPCPSVLLESSFSFILKGPLSTLQEVLSYLQITALAFQSLSGTWGRSLDSSSAPTDQLSFPSPATKCIIGQYFYCTRSPRFWGWLIVGTFYDDDGNNLWQTEILIAHRDPRGWSPETSEFDEGPPPPLFALQGMRL